MKYRYLTLPLLLWASGARAESDGVVERPASPEAAITVENVSGEIQVVGWDKPLLEVHAELSDGAEKLDVAGEGASIDVRVVRRKGRSHDASADLLVRVPRGARVRINGVSADVVATELKNTVEVETTSGDVVVKGRLREATVTTVSGEVKVDGVGARTTVQSISGDVVVSDASGELDVSTVSGEIALTGEAFNRARVKTVSGEILFSGDLAKEGTYDFEAHSGDVVLELGKATSARVEATTFSGDIGDAREHEHGEQCDDHPPEVGRRSRRFDLGSPGGPFVRVKTFSGDIVVRKS